MLISWFWYDKMIKVDLIELEEKKNYREVKVWRDWFDVFFILKIEEWDYKVVIVFVLKLGKI